MINFLELALEQERDEAVEREIPFEFLSAWKKVLGDHSFQKEWPPRPPKKAPGGESFDSLSPWTPSLNDQRRGPEGPLALETSPGFSIERKLAPAAYSVTPPGLDRWGVLTERLRAPRARSEGQGQGLGGVGLGRSAEIPLVAAVRRAERVADFVRGPRRNLTVTLPENVGGEAAGVSVEALDRAVERDARRYDGGGVFY